MEGWYGRVIGKRVVGKGGRERWYGRVIWKGGR